MEDAELISVRDQIGVMDAMLAELMEGLDKEAPAEQWMALAVLWAKIEAARRNDDLATMSQLLTQLGQMIKHGANQAGLRMEILSIFDQQRRASTAETRRLKTLEAMMTHEQAMALVATLIRVIDETFVEGEVVTGESRRAAAHKLLALTLQE